MNDIDTIIRRSLSFFVFSVCVMGLLWITPLFAQDESYVVQPGDTLSEIAKDHGTDVNTLRQLNGLGDIDFVWVGQELSLPDILATDATDGGDEYVGDEDVLFDDTLTETNVELADDSETSATVELDTVDSEAVASTSAELAPGEIAEVPTTVVAQGEKSDIYIVQRGDTLSRIAVRHRTTLAHLIEFNQISPAQRLNIGQALVVPVAGDAVATLRTIEPLVHVVAEGESLSMIARAHDVSTADLARVNGISNTGFIVPGQHLTIPNSAQPVALDSIRMGSDGYHVHTVFPTTTEKWIDVDLSEQRLVAYRGRKPVKTVTISSGFPGTPTVTGTFRIWAKTPLQDMYAGNRAVGYSYYVKDVPWVQYFYRDYGFHGAYWHNNFGNPMSHGCIHLPPEEAKWLFEWAGPTMTAPYGWFISDEEYPGTLVVIHD